MTGPSKEEINEFINASWDGDVPKLAAFLDAHGNAAASVTRGEPIGYTALMWAAQSGSAASIGLLLDRGADIDARDGEGMTPLMLAAQRNRSEAVELLAKRGANLFIRDKQGRTALDLVQAHGKAETLAAVQKAIEERGAQQQRIRNFQDGMRRQARKFRIGKAPA